MIWQQLHSLIGSYPLALRGLAMTVVLSLISLAFGTLIGFALGVLRAGDSRTLSGAIGAWVDLIRGTPFLVQIFLIFFILPEAGIELDALGVRGTAGDGFADCFPAAALAAVIKDKLEQPELAKTDGVAFSAAG